MMTIYVPSRGVGNWRALLRDPQNHWATDHSAWTLAHCWEAAARQPAESSRLPPEISRVLAQHPALEDLEPLLIIPEHKVMLDTEQAPSQNDVWVLGKTASGLVSIAVEGKVNETFDETIGKWLPPPDRDASRSGRPARLKFLRNKLGLSDIPGSIRYQLLHRAASAVIEAERFGAKHAVMLVHSFSKENLWFDDFAAFCGLFGARPAVDRLVMATAGGVPLHLAWVRGDERFLGACNCCPGKCEPDSE